MLRASNGRVRRDSLTNRRRRLPDGCQGSTGDVGGRGFSFTPELVLSSRKSANWPFGTVVSIIRANGTHDLSLQSFTKIMLSPGPAQDIARIAGGLSSPTMNRKNRPAQPVATVPSPLQSSASPVRGL